MQNAYCYCVVAEGTKGIHKGETFPEEKGLGRMCDYVGVTEMVVEVCQPDLTSGISLIDYYSRQSSFCDLKLTVPD